MEEENVTQVEGQDPSVQETATVEPSSDYQAYDLGDPVIQDDEIVKEDFFKTRIEKPNLSVSDMFNSIGKDNFSEFKTIEDYWEDSKIQDAFVSAFGSEAKYKFEDAYDNAKKEFSQFKLGNFRDSKSGHELVRDSMADVRSGFTLDYENMAGAVMQGTEWSAPTKDWRENFGSIRYKKIDENGEEKFIIEKYSPELLDTL